MSNVMAATTKDEQVIQRYVPQLSVMEMVNIVVQLAPSTAVAAGIHGRELR
jgi:hypothetical protein